MHLRQIVVQSQGSLVSPFGFGHLPRLVTSQTEIIKGQGIGRHQPGGQPEFLDGLGVFATVNQLLAFQVRREGPAARNR